MLIGDSHAQHYAPLLAELAKAYEFSFTVATHAGCAPIIGDVVFSSVKQSKSCEKVLSSFDENVSDYDVVLLAGAWSPHSEKFGEVFYDALRSTVKRLLDQERSVILLGEVPRFSKLDRTCELKSLKIQSLDCSDRLRVSSVQTDYVNAPLKAIAEKEPRVSYFEPHKHLCDNLNCTPYLGEEFVYFDGGHLSFSGSISLGRAVSNDDEPPQFLDLFDSKAQAVYSGLPWDNKLQDRVSLIQDLESVISFPGNNDMSWRGDYSFAGEGKILAFDRSSDRLSHTYINISADDLASYGVGGSVIIKAVIDQFERGSGRLEVRLSNRDNGVRESYNVVFDKKLEQFSRLGLAAISNSHVVFGDDVSVYFLLPVGSNVNLVQVIFYPSVGSSLLNYDKSAVGKININELSIYKGL